MRLFFNFFLLLVSLSTALLGQQVKKIKGQIIIDAADMSAEEIQIINLNLHRSTFSDAMGNFQIPSRLNDTLRFKSVSFENRKFIVNAQTFNSGKVFIHLNVLINRVEPVIVNKLVFTGNTEKDVKRNQNLLKSYQREKLKKKLGFPTLKKEPESANTKQVVPTIGKIPIPVSLNLSALSNLISGEYRRIRDYRMYRDQLKVLETVEDYFGEDYFIKKLKIPSTEVKNFIMYAYYYSDMKELVAEKKFSVLDVMFSKLVTDFFKRLNQKQAGE